MVLFFMYGPVLMELQKQRGLPCSYLNYSFLNIFINNSLFLAMLPEGPKNKLGNSDFPCTLSIPCLLHEAQIKEVRFLHKSWYFFCAFCNEYDRIWFKNALMSWQFCIQIMHISNMSSSWVWIDELLTGFFAVSSMGSRWSWRNWKEAVLLTKTVILSLDVLFFTQKSLLVGFVCEFIFFPVLLLGCKEKAWRSWGSWVLGNSAMLVTIHPPFCRSADKRLERRSATKKKERKKN